MGQRKRQRFTSIAHIVSPCFNSIFKYTGSGAAGHALLMYLLYMRAHCAAEFYPDFNSRDTIAIILMPWDT